MPEFDAIMLDTNILIHNPQVLYDFKNSKCKNILLSSVTLEELDKLKKESGDKGRNAREATKEIVKIVEKGKINCFQNLTIIPSSSTAKIADDKILDDLFAREEQVLFLTLDNIMYIKAMLRNQNNTRKHKIELFDASKTTKHSADDYTGRINIRCSETHIAELYTNGYVSTQNMFLEDDENGCKALEKGDLVINQFITLINANNPSQAALGRFDGKTIQKLRYEKAFPYDVHPKNQGQLFFQEALLESAEKAPLVICKGPAGTAKTFYSIAVGLEYMLNTKEPPFRKILCCRPNVQMDEDLGFLPGDEKDKIAPYFRPIIDNLEHFVGKGKNHKVEDIIAFANINFEAVAFMRGRSITDTYLIVDEAQNLTIGQVKGIITRAGKGTKVILIGDPEQIDNPYLDKVNNGLSYASAKMKGSPLCYQISMSDIEGVRSKLATEAAQRL